jgi:deaminated glutathione amidase
VPTAFAAGESDSAITGALTSEATATAAREILPKRIVVLLFFCEVHCTQLMLLHIGCSDSSTESPWPAKSSRFIGLLHIWYSYQQDFGQISLDHWYLTKIYREAGHVKIAVHQMCSTIQTHINVSSMCDAIGKASSEHAIMYLAPEMSILLDKDRNRAARHITNESASDVLKDLAAAAHEHKIWVHLGSLPLQHFGAERLVNRSIIFGPDGKVRARYDKIHLFDVDLATGESWRESAAYVGGAEPVAVDTPLGLMGLGICYDLRFPDLFSAYSRAGADILAVPSSFTVPTGMAHWHVLLRARAIETQAFVIAAAQCGSHEDGRQTYGHSLVVDPWGDVVLDMGDFIGLGFAELDLARLAEVRAQIPARANRRDIHLPVRIS